MLIKAQQSAEPGDQTGQVNALGPYYYLENFKAMLVGVEQRYGDLLDKVESDFIQTFNLLHRDAQCLLVRLITRKGPWFCRPQLNYLEINDTEGAIQALLETGFIHYDQPELSWLLHQTTKTELVRHLAEMGQEHESDSVAQPHLVAQPDSVAQTDSGAKRENVIASEPGSGQTHAQAQAFIISHPQDEAARLSVKQLKRLKKSELVSLIMSLACAETSVANHGSKQNQQHEVQSAAEVFIATLLQRLAPGEHWFSFTDKAPYRRFELLYFERLSQSLSQFILADLGIHQFDAYLVNCASRSFNTREEIEAFYHLNDLYQQFDELSLDVRQTGLSVKKIDDFCVGLTAFVGLTHQRLVRLHQGLMLQIARHYERLQEFETALRLYEACDRPPSRERRVRCLQKLAKDRQALELVGEMIDSPLEESERLVARRMQKALHRNLKLPAPDRWQGQFESLHLATERTSDRVEQSAAKQLAVVNDKKAVNSECAEITETVFCFEVENRLFCSLFGLAFWDIIFSDVKGAFANPYQSRPSDMYYSSFYPQRRAAIEARLTELSAGNTESITRHFHQKFGLTNDWVHWPLFMPYEYINQGSSTVVKKPGDAQDASQVEQGIGYLAGHLVDSFVLDGKVSSVPEGGSLALPMGDDALPLLLNLALQAFSGPMLAKLFRQMLFDLRYYRAGFPDLIRFHLKTDLDSATTKVGAMVSAELIEVKGPGDSLRDNQLIWLDWFNRHGIKASVCYLTWEGS
ncbi:MULTISPECIES: VRR-NUC domain-containing protein [Shewanella]|uniref:phosphodiesterase I n=1 Tax=Shewanella marisflavi TaxID=260364 RepID=A0ABX5WLD9_9GAMM|nr:MULTISPECIES: VRR-NUC domain-containing protein [Shewanella]QDF75398.1 VRR-NUC domain-containing protein [Shewanella marisflavi]